MLINPNPKATDWHVVYHWDPSYAPLLLQLSNVTRKQGIDLHSYADDTQLYITMSPDDLSPTKKLPNRESSRRKDPQQV